MKALLTLSLIINSVIFYNLSATTVVKCHIYKDPNAPIEKRVRDLVSRMTIEEKISQLNQRPLGFNNNANNVSDVIQKIPATIGSLIYFDDNATYRNEVQQKAMKESRLGIPIIFGYDVIHGYKTIYPISLAQACSWDTTLVQKASAMAAMESRRSGIDWVFSPMVDVARDGRWGRVAEGYGEDPLTNALFCEATVKGYQGSDLSNKNSVAACLKHYVGYSASEAGMDYVFTEISNQTLWDTYLIPFKAGVQAGAATLMSSFNNISGTPASSNYYTLTDILKKQWKHEGFVISDWDAVPQLINQGVAGTRKDAAYLAFRSGIEMDMASNCYQDYLAELIAEKKISMKQLDDAVSRVLRIKFRLGLFEQPYTQVLDSSLILSQPSKKIAEQLAEESIVLLKNNKKILPIADSMKIALIGPMVKDKKNLLGSWNAHGNESDVTSIYDAFTSLYKDVNYAAGCGFDGIDKSGFQEAIIVAKRSDIIFLCMGEKSEWSGENASRSSISLPTVQEDLILELHKIGKPIVLILSNGRPLALSRIENSCDAIVEIWQPGIAGGNPLVRVISGKVNPSGKLSITFPFSTSQIPIYYNQRKSARPYQGKYQDIPSEPLYPFAHGLSYSEFSYGAIKVSKNEIKQGENITVKIPVSNMSNIDGIETVHLYISDPVCSISRPIKELKFFKKELIVAGKTVVFKFEINPQKDLSFTDSNGKTFLESGKYLFIIKDQTVEIELTN